MKINFTKLAGGMLSPASDLEAERLTKFKTGEVYEVEIKRTRNPAHHRKGFAFFNFCFEHWSADKVEQLKDMDTQGQFDVFRKWLTCKAGFYNSYFNPEGGVRIEAKSLSFADMDQEEFEQCMNAIINAAIRLIFQGADQNTINRLYQFI